MPVETFKSREAYRKNMAYRHIHGISMNASRVCIKNEGCHTVKHSAKAKRRKTAARKHA